MSLTLASACAGQRAPRPSLHTLTTFLEVYDKKSYEKKQLEIFVDDIAYDCLVYVDPITEEGTPDEGYASTINKGIVDCNLPEDYVKKYLRDKIPVNGI